MKKLKNESALLKKAITIGEKYALNRGYKGFSETDAAKQKIEVLYRLLVQDKLIKNFQLLICSPLVTIFPTGD